MVMKALVTKVISQRPYGVHVQFEDDYRGRLSRTTATVPATFPSGAPIAAAPAGELRTIDQTAFSVLEHFLVAAGPAGPDAQRLYDAPCRINAKRTITHSKER